MTKKATHQKKAALPKKAPKKTGKRGPRPETPDGEAVVGELIEPRLPGMEDSAIEELEDAAKRYVTVRDERMALTEREVDSKDLVLTLMKRHDKQTYRRDGIEINIVHTEESVKVKFKEKD